MATRRMTLAAAKRVKPDIDAARMRRTTEAEIARQAAEDAEAPAGTLVWRVPVAQLRRRLGMTQQQFAAAIRVPLATLRNWEQHRVEPDPAARALLVILDREPEAALRALAA